MFTAVSVSSPLKLKCVYPASWGFKSEQGQFNRNIPMQVPGKSGGEVLSHACGYAGAPRKAQASPELKGC